MSDVNEVLPVTVTGTPQHRLAYDGRAWGLGKVALWNGFLTTITLGLFRFWSKTRVRRYLWSRFSFDGDRIEYTGTGGELFKGFWSPLGCFCVVIPVQIANAAIEPGTITIVLNIAYTVVVMLLFSLAPYFAQRYRMTRTRWRGIRGGLQGTVWRYLLLTVGYGVLSMITLGWTHPLGSLATKRCLWNQSRIGTIEISCEAKIGRAWWPWIINMLIWTVFLGLTGLILYKSGLGQEFIDNAGQLDHESNAALFEKHNIDIALWFGCSLIVIAVSSILGKLYDLREMRQLLNGVRIGGLRLSSTFRARRMFWRTLWLAIFQIIALVAFFLMIGMIVGLEIVPENQGGILMAFVVSYIVLSGLMNLLVTMLWTNRLLGQIALSTGFSGDLDMATVQQSRDTAPRRGEGLVELFSVDG